MSIVDKKTMERETAELFCTWLNKVKNTNYKAEEDSENRESDCILSDEGKEQIKLQITTAEHSTIGSWVKTSKNPGLIDMIDLDHEKNILTAIKSKSSKYSDDVQKELILLIYKIVGPAFDPEYLKNKIREQCPKNNFKAIYFIELPTTAPRQSYPLRKGNVIQLV